MSATLDAEPVARFLDDCPIIRAEGRSHAITVDYRPVDRPASAETLVPLIEEQLEDPRAGGHILVFLPGMAEIRRVEKRLAAAASRTGRGGIASARVASRRRSGPGAQTE